MIKIYTRVTFALVSFIFISPLAHAQLTKEAVTQALDEVLSTYLVGVFPHISCPCNNCEHTYTGNISIERTGRNAVTFQPVRIEERITIWGTADATQVSNFLGSEANIVFYAEIREVAGSADVVKLKWKQNDCMQYAMLLNKDDADFVPDSAHVARMDSIRLLKKKRTELAIAESEQEFGLSPTAIVSHGTPSPVVPEPYQALFTGAINSLPVAGVDAPTQETGHEMARMAPAGSISEESVTGIIVDIPESETPNEAADELDTSIQYAFDGKAAMENDVIGTSTDLEPLLVKHVVDVMVPKAVDIPADTAAQKEWVEPAPVPVEEEKTPPVAEKEDLSKDPVSYLTITYELQEKSAKKGKKKSDEQEADATATHTLTVTIMSSASDTRIKDAVLELAFYSKTDTKLAAESRILYEFFVPGQSTSISFGVTPPEFTDHPRITLVKATWVENTTGEAP